MNEISILMHLLSNKCGLYQIGATEEEILQSLKIAGKNKAYYFQNLLTNLSKYIEPLGLKVKFNPIDSHWFLSFDSELSDTLNANPFEGKPRLAATLFSVLVYCLQNSGIGQIQDIKNLRNKKNVIGDLKELEKLGYIEMLKDSSKIQLTPLIGYQLNIEHLFIRMALKLKNQE